MTKQSEQIIEALIRISDALVHQLNTKDIALFNMTVDAPSQQTVTEWVKQTEKRIKKASKNNKRKGV